jgi:hypothetical protein
MQAAVDTVLDFFYYDLRQTILQYVLHLEKTIGVNAGDLILLWNKLYPALVIPPIIKTDAYLLKPEIMQSLSIGESRKMCKWIYKKGGKIGEKCESLAVAVGKSYCNKHARYEKTQVETEQSMPGDNVSRVFDPIKNVAAVTHLLTKLPMTTIGNYQCTQPLYIHEDSKLCFTTPYKMRPVGLYEPSTKSVRPLVVEESEAYQFWGFLPIVPDIENYNPQNDAPPQ